MYYFCINRKTAASWGYSQKAGVIKWRILNLSSTEYCSSGLIGEIRTRFSQLTKPDMQSLYGTLTRKKGIKLAVDIKEKVGTQYMYVSVITKAFIVSYEKLVFQLITDFLLFKIIKNCINGTKNKIIHI